MQLKDISVRVMLLKHLYKPLATVTYSCEEQRSGEQELYDKLKLNRLNCFPSHGQPLI